MDTAAALRIQIEDALATRFPAALTPVPRTIREVAATGIPAADDALLEGGLPVGAISELVGPECSGRTSLALAFVARRTADGQVCAWIDADDTFDPESAAASGVRLRQLLWVRCRDAARRLRTLEERRKAVDATRSGPARDGPAFAGGRLCGHRAGPWRMDPAHGMRDSTGLVVSFSTGRGSHPLQSGGAGPGILRAIERRSGGGLRCFQRAEPRVELC